MYVKFYFFPYFACVMSDVFYIHKMHLKFLFLDTFFEIRKNIFKFFFFSLKIHVTDFKFFFTAFLLFFFIFFKIFFHSFTLFSSLFFFATVNFKIFIQLFLLKHKEKKKIYFISSKFSFINFSEQFSKKKITEGCFTF